MADKLIGIWISARELQVVNAYVPIDSTLSGIVTAIKLLLVNASKLITSTPF